MHPRQAKNIAQKNMQFILQVLPPFVNVSLEKNIVFYYNKVVRLYGGKGV